MLFLKNGAYGLISIVNLWKTIEWNTRKLACPGKSRIYSCSLSKVLCAVENRTQWHKKNLFILRRSIGLQVFGNMLWSFKLFSSSLPSPDLLSYAALLKMIASHVISPSKIKPHSSFAQHRINYKAATQPHLVT